MPYLYTTAEEMSRTGLPIDAAAVSGVSEWRGGWRAAGPEQRGRVSAGAAICWWRRARFRMRWTTTRWRCRRWAGTTTGPARAWMQARDGKAIDNAAVVQPEVRIHRTLDTLPVFVRAGSIVPEQPLVQSTDEKPQGPLTLRVYPPTAIGQRLRRERSIWTMASATTSSKGDFLRDGVHVQADGAGRGGDGGSARGTALLPWWKQLSVEVYGAAKPASERNVSRRSTARAATPVSTGISTRSITASRRWFRMTARGWSCS